MKKRVTAFLLATLLLSNTIVAYSNSEYNEKAKNENINQIVNETVDETVEDNKLVEKLETNNNIKSLSNTLDISVLEPKDISKDTVRQITFDKQEVTDGNYVKVSVKFDDTMGKINSGDIITINWDKVTDYTDNAWIEAFQDKIQLEMNGDSSVADVNINNHGVEIVFNDDINKSEVGSVEGTVTFTVSARNTSEIDKDIVISSGEQSNYITVKGTPRNDYEVEFYYKSGNISPSNPKYANWYLSINYDKKPAENSIVIKDNIINEKNHLLVEDSFVFTIIDKDNNYTFYSKEGDKATEDFEADFNAKLSIDGNSFVLEIPKESITDKSILIVYNTEVLNKKARYLYNESEITYLDDTGTEVDKKESDANVENPDASGSASSAKSKELIITKTIKDTDTPVPNVKFEITREDGGTIKNEEKVYIISDDEGKAGIKDLKAGTYIIKEIEAPEYVVIEDREYTFTVKADELEGHNISIENSIKNWDSINVEKIWYGKVGKDTNVSLYDNNDKLVESINLESPDFKGEFTNIPRYDEEGNEILYHIEEETQKNYKSIIKSNSEDGFIIINIEMIDIYVKKEWEGKKQDSVEINLYKEELNELNLIDKITLIDPEWKDSFKDVELYDEEGNEIKYIIKESEVKGYRSQVSGDFIEGITVKNTEIKDDSVEIPTEKPEEKPEEKPNEKPEEKPSEDDDDDRNNNSSYSGKSSSKKLSPKIAETITQPRVNGRHIAYYIGYEDGTIRPDNYISREEVAVVVYKLLGLQGEGTNNYTDINSDRWSYNYVNGVSNLNIMEGYADGTFKGSEAITRGEVAKIISLLSDKIEIKTSVKKSDYENHWAEKYIEDLYNKELAVGDENYNFRPDDKIKRSEFSVLINKLFDRQSVEENRSGNINKFSDLEKGKWYYDDLVEASNHHTYEKNENTEVWTGTYK